MGKRFWSLALSLALIGGVFSVLPATAQEASPVVAIPSVVQIDDPVNDANYLNDQSLLTNVPRTQDNGTAADVGSTSDVMKVWYSADPTTVSVNIQTQVPPPADAGSYIYRVFSNPGEGSVTTSTLGCLRFFVFMPSGTPPAGGYSGPQKAGLLDYCDKGTDYTKDASEGKLTITELPDGTGVMTVTVPRSYSPKLADGQIFTAPQVQVQNLIGTGTDGNGQPIPATDGSVPSGNWRRGPQIDNSVVGTDWTIVGGGDVIGGPGKPAKPKPGKNDPPGKGKKNGCGKGKGQQKGACPGKKPPKPKPPVATCAPYTPGEEGAEAGPAAVVTDAATADKPVELTVTVPEGVGVGGLAEDAIGHAFQNVQVDSAAPSTGLYARLEMPPYADYDVYVKNADGTVAAQSAGFNPAPVVPGFTDGTGTGGHSEQGAENIDGVETADCGGYTFEIQSASAEGGDLKLTLWLGAVGYTPGSASAADMFFGMLKMKNPMARSTDSSESAQASSTPAANKGCKKGKGKKKGCKKPPVASCAAFVPGEAGTDKPLATVTDTATAEAPVEQKVNLEMSVGDLDQTGMVDHGSADFFNVQVDSANPDAGLYVLFEFPMRRDYDLNLLHTDGSYAARSRRWNTFSESTDSPAPFNVSTTGYGGEGTDATELLAGIRTADCGGWTVSAENWLGEGGEFTIKMWLGEAKYDPQPPGTET